MVGCDSREQRSVGADSAQHHPLPTPAQPHKPLLLVPPTPVCRTLYIPPDDRSGWEQLQAQVLYLLAQTLAARQEGPHNVQVRSKQARPTHMQDRILDDTAHPPPFDNRALIKFSFVKLTCLAGITAAGAR